MKKIALFLILLTSAIEAQNNSHFHQTYMQGNNVNFPITNDGRTNRDFLSVPYSEAGFVWPASSSTRKTAIYNSGIWLGAKVGPQRDLRIAVSSIQSHFTPGNIPVIGSIPPASVCSDSSWRCYLVQLTDPALVNGGIRIKQAGGRQYTFVYDSWAQWPVSKGAPFVELNGIPGYQPSFNGDRPGIGNGSTARPDDLSFTSFMDYTNCTNNLHMSQTGFPGGTLPLGVHVHQLSFMFNCPPLENMYYIKWRVMNKSSLVWDSVYFSNYVDIDIGYGSCGSGDDALGCDTSRNLAMIYNDDDNDCNYGANPPAAGTSFLQSPLRFTGNNSDTAKLPYDTLSGYKLIGMTAYVYFLGTTDPCYSDPSEYYEAYNFMRGKNACGNSYVNPLTGNPTAFTFNGNSCSRTGWIDTIGQDRRYLQSSGPFKMNSGDTQIVVTSFMITRDGGNNFQNVCALQSVTDSALKYYYNDFKLCTIIGIQPISTEIPQRFELFQNYPNPFNPVTKIRFSIPVRNGHDRSLLKIYDAIGREIATLVNEELNPGTYEIDWDASSYPSGVYFYKLESGTFLQTRKMVLVK